MKFRHFTFGFKRCAAGIALLLLAGCASESTLRNYVPQIVTPYRMDIQQGNFVTEDMVSKLAVGQTREQVRFILGTPLLADVFHANRWDYIFRFSKGWKEPEKRKLVIFFDAANRVERWEADVPPPSAAGAVPPDAAPAPPKPQALPAVPAAGEGASGPAGSSLPSRPPVAALDARSAMAVSTQIPQSGAFVERGRGMPAFAQAGGGWLIRGESFEK